MKVLVIIPWQYNRSELWTALGVMLKRGIEFEVVSLTKRVKADGPMPEGIGEESLRLDHTVYEIDSMEPYAGIQIQSGSLESMEEIWFDKKVRQLVEEVGRDNKPASSACHGGVALRFIAEGKKISCYPLQKSKDLLRKAGAWWCSLSITVDGNLITGETQISMQTVTELFCDMLEGHEVSINLTDALPLMRTHSKLPRRLPTEIERAIYPPEEFERLQELDRQRGKIR